MADPQADAVADTRGAPRVPRARRARRGLAGLLTANFVSMLGTRMSSLALPWFVLVTTGSPAETGLVVFAEMAPYVLVQGFGGPMVDRYGTWRISILTDAIAAVAFGLVPALYLTGTLSLGAIVALVAIVGAVRGAGDTARRVLVPGLADAAWTPLERASGWYDAISRAAGMIGAPAAGVLIALISAPAVLAVDAATFLASAVVVGLAVPRSAQPSRAAGGEAGSEGEAEAETSYLDALKEGFAHLAGDRLLLGIAGMVLVTNLVDQAFSAVLTPVWANQATGSPVVLGAMGAAMGIGALLGNGTVAWLGPRLPRRLTYAWGFLIAGSPRFFVLAAVTNVAPAVGIAFIAGLGAGGINPILGAVEFERVPRHLQARVLGALGATAWAGIPFGALVGGALVEQLGLQGALVAAGAVYLVTTLAPFVFPVWREMDRGTVVRHDAARDDEGQAGGGTADSGMDRSSAA